VIKSYFKSGKTATEMYQCLKNFAMMNESFTSIPLVWAFSRR